MATTETMDTDWNRIVITEMGGLCPLQAEGTIDGEPFYFRARGSSWSIEVGPGNTAAVVAALGSDYSDRAAADAVETLPVWRYGEHYGEWPEAGYMPEHEAVTFIAKAAVLYRERAARPTQDERTP